MRSRLGRVLREDHGVVSAEFAIVLPAVLVVLGLVIGGVMLTAHRVTLVSAAADVARLEARGDLAVAGERLAALPHAASVARSSRGALHCVTLESRPGVGLLSRIPLTATSCAARSEAAERVT